jgi:hypothetical protein
VGKRERDRERKIDVKKWRGRDRKGRRRREEKRLNRRKGGKHGGEKTIEVTEGKDNWEDSE